MREPQVGTGRRGKPVRRLVVLQVVMRSGSSGHPKSGLPVTRRTGRAQTGRFTDRIRDRLGGARADGRAQTGPLTGRIRDRLRRCESGWQGANRPTHRPHPGSASAVRERMAGRKPAHLPAHPGSAGRCESGWQGANRPTHRPFSRKRGEE